MKNVSRRVRLILKVGIQNGAGCERNLVRPILIENYIQWASD